MSKDIKMITFDLDDTLWDNMPTITKAEIDTRNWIEEQTGKVEWGTFEDFLETREKLIKNDESIAWDISKLRKEIFKIKLDHIRPRDLRDEIVEEAFKIFITKRHEITLFEGVEEALEKLSKNFVLGVLTNGNADIFKFDIGKYFKFSISSLEAKDSKPNRAHFDEAIKRVDNINFENILHIGDHQINDIFGAFNLGIESLWFNNKGVEWNQSFTKPDEFSSWKNLPELISKKYD
tara:strand:- start:2122 stop:2826 length:705 start_codon:yes stop_codon:yes gene_type:complete